jgi:hypothetical protein
MIVHRRPKARSLPSRRGTAAGIVALAIGIPGPLLFPATAHSSGEPREASPDTSISPACRAPEYRHFDFWLGEWDVKTADGRQAGTSRIERILGGCAIEENWSGAGGMKGRSVSHYEPEDGKWHQTWIDTGALILRIEGGLRDGKMVLTGTLPDSTGSPVLQRIIWEKLPDGRVRQHWQSARRNQGPWEDVFLGFYRKRR